MNQKRTRKTLDGSTAQTLLKSARIEDGRLLVEGKHGATYVAQRSPSGALGVREVTSGWGVALELDAWGRAELAWWEAQLEALTPARTVWLLLDGGVVVGHLAAPELAHDPEAAHPWRVNNAAQRPVPALGEPYEPPPEPVRPRRTRGPSARG